MNPIALATWFAFAIPSLLLAQAQHTERTVKHSSTIPAVITDEEEIISAIRSRLDATARNDIKTWARYVADDCLAPLEGSIGTKQAWIKEHESWPSAVKYYYGPLEDIKIRIHGDTAVVAYRAKQFNDIGGQITYQQTWQIETHMRRGKEWVQVAVADAPIALEPIPVKADPKSYDAYVGQYEWAPTLFSTITREGDKLFEKYTGQEKVEFLPENEETFFIKGSGSSGDTSRFIFVRDQSGKVTHYIYRLLGSTDRIVRKTK